MTLKTRYSRTNQSRLLHNIAPIFLLVLISVVLESSPTTLLVLLLCLLAQIYT